MGSRRARLQARRLEAPKLRPEARRLLADYLTNKHIPPREGSKDPANIIVADIVADVLSIYLEDKKDEIVRINKTAERGRILLDWWGEKRLSEVNGKSCHDYVKWRTSQPLRQSRPDKTGRPARMVSMQRARREFEDMRAAINHHRREA